MKIGDLLTEETRRYKMPIKTKTVKKIEDTFDGRIGDAIREIFYECRNLKIDVVGKTLSFELGTQIEVQFEKLHQLSQILGTLQIDFTGGKQYDDGCDSCGYGATEDPATIECREVSTDFFDRMSAPARG